MMNSVLISSNGHLKFGQIPSIKDAKLHKNQVKIKVECAVINPSDILFMRGKYSIPIKYPYTPGWEGSGTIVEVGEKVHKSMIGMKVGFNKEPELKAWKVGGAMADYAFTTPTSVIPMQEGMTFEQGATFFVNPLTAYCMVYRVKELKSKCCIVTAAASQIGQMIIKLLLKNGIKPFCTVRREA